MMTDLCTHSVLIYGATRWAYNDFCDVASGHRVHDAEVARLEGWATRLKPRGTPCCGPILCVIGHKNEERRLFRPNGCIRSSRADLS